MKHPPRISDAEWQVMEVVWSGGPLAATDVIHALAGRTDWKPNTVRTLLARLVRKGALRVEPEGNRYIYHPLFSRGQYVTDESDSFLDRVFRGSTGPLLLHFAEKSELSDKQIAELKRILEKGGK